ncbi:MAG: hypothetical protein A2504_11380 [Bdellovibrionales bacterium RIFOXYD12_FULL_39_22]|nr:MAG: hypothetical protein A2385_09945 [Bdellovibrionales bacterium RIFOXYB1_FULL_39_21]OFZ44273.1 MAG: hypothetical protein A2485_07565 [Bdellovibrionales bacterium RIFOXYC12_FULL_39_17]OFZ46815.1 MAG: hypothetical protein A2404_04800 [Bdellovibrionales bacterium RIFOXYC1_FULL_39_130]OFZ71006.1 MAG: hypothetical protein A2451_00300 [Bdellovibrionales bacterium RIFOXYC2_FULL_39_8]OFZ75908.1 MAG: hypothetical protein A2560_02350 [Bdellovibrionales bacterium RIFOXYD1_FULL_39_84]OFZ95494.1 MAG:
MKNETQQPTSSINDQLKVLINQYFERYPNMSINGLAKKSGVGTTTLRRIIHQSTKNEPAPHTVLNIISTIYKEKRVPTLLKSVDGPVGEMLNRAFGGYVYTDNKEYVFSDEINEALKDTTSYLIYKLAANRCGTTLAKIKEMFGEIGVAKYDLLKEANFLNVHNNGEIHAKEKNFSIDLFLAKKHLKELVEFYKPEELSDNKNIFYTLSESMNEDGIKKIKDVQREAAKKTLAIMKEESNQGMIPYFTVNLADTIESSKKPGVLQ